MLDIILAIINITLSVIKVVILFINRKKKK